MMYTSMLRKVLKSISSSYEGWSKQNDYLTQSQYRKLLKNLSSLHEKTLKAYEFALKHKI